MYKYCLQHLSHIKRYRAIFTPMVILLCIWSVCCVILIGYYLWVFRVPVHKPDSTIVEEKPGVSIVIAIKNGHKNFTAYLEEILKQDYPLFEIIIVDDHSGPGTLDAVQNLIPLHPQLKLIQSTTSSGKKNALILGIQQATFPYILCTDADCFPQTSHWIEGMMRYADRGTLVLGYSPYEKRKGFLNLWIRFETLITGMQYLSWAGLGKPYMGVGRNLLFPKEWFLKTQPLSDVLHIPYGDDDFIVQQASGQLKIIPSMDQQTFVVSQPETTWKAWWRQKHRHMSAGHHYQVSSWLKPGMLGMALTGHWFIFPLIWHQMYPWLLICFLIALLFRWIRYATWTRKLGDRDTLLLYPLLEAAYALYLAVMGFFTLINRKKTWN